MDFSIKLCLNRKIKRVPSQSSYLALCQTINDLFSLNNEMFILHYLNEDNNQIAIENETDYLVALEFAFIQKIILKVIVKLQKDQSNDAEEGLALNNSLKDYSSNDEHEKENEKEEDQTEFFQCNSCYRSFASSRSFMAHYNVCAKIFTSQTKKFDLNTMRLKGIAKSNGGKISTLINKSFGNEANEALIECKECSKLIKACFYSKHLNICKNKVKKQSNQSNSSIQNIISYEKMLFSHNFINYLEQKKKKSEDKK